MLFHNHRDNLVTSYFGVNATTVACSTYILGNKCYLLNFDHLCEIAVSVFSSLYLL